MKKFYIILLFSFLLLWFSQAVYSDTTYTFVDIGGYNYTTAKDVNNFGQIVGYYDDPYNWEGYTGFLRLNEAVVNVEYPGAKSTYAIKINNNGLILVSADLGGSTIQSLYNTTVFVLPVYPPCSDLGGLVTDINLSGIVGYCGDGAYGFFQNWVGNNTFFSFPDGHTKIRGINDNGVIVGHGLGDKFYLGNASGMFYTFEIPGASEAAVFDVNNGGQIVGFYRYSTWNNDVGFLRDPNGKIATIQVPNNIISWGTVISTYVYGINDLGWLVGDYKYSLNDCDPWCDLGDVFCNPCSGEDLSTFVAIPAANPLPADLIVTNIVTDPVYPSPGEQFNLYVTVKNQGAHDASGFFLEWYANESSSPSPPPFGNQRQYISGLAVGATYTMTTTWTFSTAGVYPMYGFADSWYAIYETNENNNVLGPVSIEVAECIGDFNGDGAVNGLDFIMFRNEWGNTGCNEPDTDCLCDMNGDGTVNGLDFILFRNNWGNTCP